MVRSGMAVSTCCSLLFTLTNAARAQEPIELVSMSYDGTGDGGCDEYVLNPVSVDGRYVAFSSRSSRLIENDTNGKSDVFVRDRWTGTNILVSVASDGTQGNEDSTVPGMSGDGRFVAFASWATNFYSDDQNRRTDIFLRDRDPDGNGVFDEGNATTILLSRKWNGERSDDSSWRPSVSGDGSVVVFESASDLTQDANGSMQIYAYEVATGTLTDLTVSYDGNFDGGTSTGASVSSDGRYVAFESYSSRLIRHDTNGYKDIFVHDRQDGVNRRVSVATDGTEGNGDSFDASISADGAVVVFSSDAANLVPGDTNAYTDVFARDRANRITTRVSVLNDGTQADAYCLRPVCSGDGRFVAFYTWATTLVPLDKNGAADVVFVDRSTGVFETISADCIGRTANARSSMPAITPDGRFVSFFSGASNLNDGGFSGDLVYLRDRTIAWPTATQTSYGDGWSGALGVPELTANVNPQYGATVDVNFGNSWGYWTVGFLMLGTAQASIETSKDGTLLVDTLISIPLAIAPYGTITRGVIPFDEALCGFELDLQGIELDPGASRGTSFTPGLQLIIGR